MCRVRLHLLAIVQRSEKLSDFAWNASWRVRPFDWFFSLFPKSSNPAKILKIYETWWPHPRNIWIFQEMRLPSTASNEIADLWSCSKKVEELVHRRLAQNRTTHVRQCLWKNLCPPRCDYQASSRHGAYGLSVQRAHARSAKKLHPFDAETYLEHFGTQVLSGTH